MTEPKNYKLEYSKLLERFHILEKQNMEARRDLADLVEREDRLVNKCIEIVKHTKGVTVTNFKQRMTAIRQILRGKKNVKRAAKSYSE